MESGGERSDSPVWRRQLRTRLNALPKAAIRALSLRFDHNPQAPHHPSKPAARPPDSKTLRGRCTKGTVDAAGRCQITIPHGCREDALAARTHSSPERSRHLHGDRWNPGARAPLSRGCTTSDPAPGPAQSVLDLWLDPGGVGGFFEPLPLCSQRTDKYRRGDEPKSDARNSACRNRPVGEST